MGEDLSGSLDHDHSITGVDKWVLYEYSTHPFSTPAYNSNAISRHWHIRGVPIKIYLLNTPATLEVDPPHQTEETDVVLQGLGVVLGMEVDLEDLHGLPTALVEIAANSDGEESRIFAEETVVPCSVGKE